MDAILVRILTCLIYTEVLELSAAALCRVRKKQDFLVVALINLATNPIVTFVLTLIPFFRIYAYSGWILLGMELFAFVTEGCIYRYSRLSRPFLLSAVLNAVSYFGGLVIRIWIL